MDMTNKIRKRVNRVLLCGVVLSIVISGSEAHLLPQALEDVHAFVQSELQQRSQGDKREVGIEGPPQGGPRLQTTTTYIGTPIVFQNDVRLNGNGGVQKNNDDLGTAQTQNVGRSGEEFLARGLVPPSHDENVQISSASSLQPEIIPANVVGPSTFVSDGPSLQESSTRHEGIDVPDRNGASKTMEGWIPIDAEGTRLAKGVGVKIQGDDDVEDVQVQTQAENNGGTTTIQLNDLVIGSKDLAGNGLSSSRKVTAKYPVYPGNTEKSPKVVIHAQNVIIRGDGRAGGDSDPLNNGTQIRQFQAYGMVPQLNNFLRDQLRMAAMNQLLQSHPLNDKPFPRPLSLREIAQAARNGQFPKDLSADPLLQQASLITPHHLAINIPHVVKMSKPAHDPLALSSIQTQSKHALPGFGYGGGLGNLIRNMFQGSQGELLDPRESLDYSLMAQLAGQRLKVPSVPTFKSKPGAAFTSDYGDSVTYTAGKDVQDSDKEPIKIVSAEPALNDHQAPQIPNFPPAGNLRDISDDLLKQMIIQQLNAAGGPSPLAPSGPLKSSRPTYGTNSHPFAFLSNPDSAHEESYEYGTGYPGGSPYLQTKRPNAFSLSGLEGYASGGDTAGIAPLSKDMVMEFGKGLLYSAIDFSKKHNPMTFISKIRSLPPVKFEFYRTPVGVPEEMFEKIPPKYRGGAGGGGERGRGRRKHLPRKNNPKY